MGDKHGISGKLQAAEKFADNLSFPVPRGFYHKPLKQQLPQKNDISIDPAVILNPVNISIVPLNNLGGSVQCSGSVRHAGDKRELFH